MSKKLEQSEKENNSDNELVLYNQKIVQLQQNQIEIANLLEKYAKEGINVKNTINLLVQSLLVLKHQQVALMNQVEKLNNSIDQVQTQISELDHNVSSEDQLSNWMKEESKEMAFDSPLTGEELSKKLKDYDNELMRFNRRRY